MPIVVRQLSFRYMAGTPLERRALSEISFEVQDGEFVGIIGRTGSGKSTLIQHLNGLIRPPMGTVWVDGVDLGGRDVDLRAIRFKVGLLFQFPEQQLFEETVARDVAFGPRNMGLESGEIERRVRRALALVGLDYEQFASRSPFELSGGERRRVAFAGVLAMEPSVLVLDEPTSGLDPRGRDEVLGLVERLHRRGMTVLLVTHNMEDVARSAQRLLVLHEGRLLANGTPRELFGRRAGELRAAGLGIPEAAALMAELRVRGAPASEEVITVPEAVEEIGRLWRQGLLPAPPGFEAAQAGRDGAAAEGGPRGGGPGTSQSRGKAGAGVPVVGRTAARRTRVR